MTWLLIIAIYAAPPTAVNWNGPWELGMTKLMEGQFDSETECHNTAVRFKAKMQEGMLAPMRYRCVGIDAGLPQGANR
jgi:hypothetical protein